MNLVNGIGREAALAGMFKDHFLVGGNIDAVDLVAGHIALHPLDLRAEFAEHPAGSLGDAFELFGGQVPRTGDLAFNYVLRHGGWFNGYGMYGRIRKMTKFNRGNVGVYPEGAWGGMKKVYRREERAEGNVEF